MIQSYLQRLSIEARNEKAEAIFAFITSPACSDLFERVSKLTADVDFLRPIRNHCAREGVVEACRPEPRDPVGLRGFLRNS